MARNRPLDIRIVAAKKHLEKLQVEEKIRKLRAKKKSLRV